MRGRKPLPTEVKKSNGNPGGRPLYKPKPEVDPSIPKKPAYIKGVSAKMWREIVELLKDMKVLRKSDGVALQLFCQAYAQWRTNDEIIQEKGGVYITKNVNGDKIVKTLPQVKIAAEAWRRVQSMLAEFGMTPAARARLAVDEKPESELAKLMRRVRESRAASDAKLRKN